MAIPTITMSCNSLPLTAIETAAVNCELDTSVKKFGRGSIKVLQGGYIVYTLPENFDIYSNMWSADFWVYFSDTTAQYSLLNNDNNQNGCFGFQFLNGNFAAYVRGNSGQSITGPEAQQDVWQHVRVTHQGSGTLKYYLNGTFFGTNRFTKNSNVLQTSIAGGATYWGAGNIDEFALTILDSSNVAEYSGDTAPVPTEGYPDEVRSPGVVINGLFLSTSKPTANQKGLLINNKFFIPFAKSSGSGGDTSAFESDAMAIIGTPTEGGGDIEPISQKYMTVTSTNDVGCGVGIEFTGTIQIVEDGVATLYTTSPISNIALRNATVYGDNITYFNCGSTNLASVDPSHNDQLVTLICSNGYLTALDISNNSLLTTLEANSNNLSSAVVDKILSDLVAHGKSNGLLRLENSAGIGAASNGAPTSQNNVTTLQSRGWTVTTA